MSLPTEALIYGREILGTYHERMGGLPWPESTVVGNRPKGFWGRIIGADTSYDGASRGPDAGSPSFDFSYYAVQVGTDLWRSDDSDGYLDRAGIYGAFGHADGSVEHRYSPSRRVSAGDTSFDAYTIGGYFTRTGPTDWYIDAVAQITHYDFETTGRFGTETTNGWGFAASIEGGHPFALDDGWTLEPQAQLVYQTLDIDDVRDEGARVSYSDLDSLAGRIGVRLARVWDRAGPDGAALPTSVWGRVNLWHELSGEPTTTFSVGNSDFPFDSELDRSWAELGVGFDVQNANGWSFYGDASYDVTFDGNADGVAGQLGIKYRW